MATRKKKAARKAAKKVSRKAPKKPAKKAKKKAPTKKRHSLDALFRPRAIAVVGASRRQNQIGHQIVRNLVEGGFTGPVYPVNPTATVVHSMHCLVFAANASARFSVWQVPHV